MESMDDDVSPDERQLDGCATDDHKRLLLKKNLSWTNCNSVHYSSLAKLNSLKTSRSNPLVLDDIAPNAKCRTPSKLKLATSQLLPNCFQSQPTPSHLSADDVNHRQLAPLAKAFSASTLTAATTHQTLATPTALQLNVGPKSDLKFYCRAIARHCKVKKNLALFIKRNFRYHFFLQKSAPIMIRQIFFFVVRSIDEENCFN